MSEVIRVEFHEYDFINCRGGDAEIQFLIRMKLRSAGIPIGEWNTIKVQHGTLQCWDDLKKNARVMEWRNEQPPRWRGLKASTMKEYHYL